MKNIILSTIAVLLLGAVSLLTVDAAAQPQKCYTHVKKWHDCPVQPR